MEQKHKKKKRSGIEQELHGLDIALLFVAGFIIAFTVAMIVVFLIRGETPDALIGCVFGAAAFECGAGAYIQTRKARLEDRKWALEDQKRETRERKRNERNILPDSSDDSGYRGGNYGEVPDSAHPG